jgi:hypothetical protein
MLYGQEGGNMIIYPTKFTIELSVLELDLLVSVLEDVIPNAKQEGYSIYDEERLQNMLKVISDTLNKGGN